MHEPENLTERERLYHQLIDLATVFRLRTGQYERQGLERLATLTHRTARLLENMAHDALEGFDSPGSADTRGD